MPGIFTIGEKKVRPGVYYRYENVGGVSGAGAVNGIGAALIKANWGPLNKVVELDVTSNTASFFGSGLTADVITEMFAGGASQIKAVRIGNGGTACKVVLKDDAEPAAEVVEIAARYVGERDFSVSIRESLISDNKECVIYDGVREFEKVEFVPGENEIENLVAAFAKSSNFIVTKKASGSGNLAMTAQVKMVGGTNPITTAEDYSAGLNALEAYKWNVLCVDTSDIAIHSLIAAYVDRIAQLGMFPMACLAETASLDFDTRLSHAAAYNNEKIVYVLNPAADAAGNIYDGYRLAARIGGMVAAVPANTSLTHEVIKGFVALEEPLTNSQVINAIQKGCVCLTKNASGQIWIESAVNTLVTPGAEQDEGWKKIRRTKTRFELMDRIVTTVDPLIGKINNDENGRATIISAAQGIVNTMVGEKKLLPGGLVKEDPNNLPQGDSAWFVILVDDIDSVEKAYLTFQFRFSPNV